MKPVQVTGGESDFSSSPKFRMSPRQRFDDVLDHKKPDKQPF